MTDVRQLLAEAASTVTGVTVTPHYRQSIGAGDGMVRRDRTDYPNSLGGVVTWQVIICLPKDLGQAQKWLDDRIPAVVTALTESGEITVTSAEPQQLPLDSGGSYPIALITGIREETE